MFAVAADPSRNLLEMKFVGRVTPDELQSEMGHVHELLLTLKPGFRLLTDLSAMTEMDLGCRPIIDGMMDTLNRECVGKVVRVIPDPAKDIGFGIMSLFHYREEVRVITCETEAEARQALD